jgi:hypothetical protein
MQFPKMHLLIEHARVLMHFQPGSELCHIFRESLEAIHKRLRFDAGRVCGLTLGVEGAEFLQPDDVFVRSGLVTIDELLQDIYNFAKSLGMSCFEDDYVVRVINIPRDRAWLVREVRLLMDVHEECLIIHK